MAMTNAKTQRDVVCGMEVSTDAYLLTHRGIDYAFCSAACRDRFKQRPHLFIGDPKRGQSLKQQGERLTKSHRIGLETAITDTLATSIYQEINRLMGIERIDILEGEITVHYDLLQVSLSDIEAAIIKAHGELSTAITERLKSQFIRYTEECELDNAAHLGGDNRCH